jgi:hypothetical protein
MTAGPLSTTLVAEQPKKTRAGLPVWADNPLREYAVARSYGRGAIARNSIPDAIMVTPLVLELIAERTGSASGA